MHFKPKIDSKNNGKWKLQTYFSCIYKPIKNVAELVKSFKQDMLGWLGKVSLGKIRSS